VADRSDPEFVAVFESSDAVAVGLAKGLLEDSGIPFLTESGETAARLVLGPIAFPACRFLVPRDREEEARDLLDQLAFPAEGEHEL
jgi:hypothetical protein